MVCFSNSGQPVCPCRFGFAPIQGGHNFILKDGHPNCVGPSVLAFQVFCTWLLILKNQSSFIEFYEDRSMQLDSLDACQLSLICFCHIMITAGKYCYHTIIPGMVTHEDSSG